MSGKEMQTSQDDSKGRKSSESKGGSSSVGRNSLIEKSPTLLTTGQTQSPVFPSRANSNEESLLESGKDSQENVQQMIFTGHQKNISSSSSKIASIRKRSRVRDASGFDNLTIGENANQKKKVDNLLGQLQTVIEGIVKKGDKGKAAAYKAMVNEILKDISVEIVSCLTFANSLAMRIISTPDVKHEQEKKKIIILDENNSLRQQIIELQSQVKQSSQQHLGEGSGPYLQAVLKKTTANINEGRVLPILVVPDSVRHVPSEKILIFKAREKGEQATKKEQEQFRIDLSNTIDEELIKRITVIRPTRYGGHTVIFQTEESRDEALKVLRENEKDTRTENSCIISPKKKLANVICRDPPQGITPDNFVNEMYGVHNPLLHKISENRREAKVFMSTSLGWIFEMTSEEAQAFHMQGGRIRYGFGREIKTEEFIPLQQCYKCCLFGHNANDCSSEIEFCGLCGKSGHAGKDCTKKNEKEKWNCINCKNLNETKGFNLLINHAAAQLHKCPYALNQKMIKKEQRAARCCGGFHNSHSRNANTQSREAVQYGEGTKKYCE